MSLTTFRDSLEFIRNYNVPSVVLSGGEPFLHPDIMEILNLANDDAHERKCIWTVATNGEWLVEHRGAAKKIFNRYQYLLFQITNDKRYYSRKINLSDPLFRRSNVFTESAIPSLYLQGRALKNGYVSFGSTTTKCANIRLVGVQLKLRGELTLERLIRTLFDGGKHCTPQIKVDGSLANGESSICKSLATIYDSESVILDAIMESDCNICQPVMKKYGGTFISKDEMVSMINMADTLFK